MIIQICIGSACHLKGSPEVVELLQKSVEQYKLEGEITLAGSFCAGRCNREGVTIQVDEEIYTGITPESFREFFNDKVLAVIQKGRK